MVPDCHTRFFSMSRALIQMTISVLQGRRPMIRGCEKIIMRWRKLVRSRRKISPCFTASLPHRRPYLAVWVEPRQHTRCMAVLEEMPSNLQVQPALELLHSFLQCSRLQGKIFIAIEAFGSHFRSRREASKQERTRKQARKDEKASKKGRESKQERTRKQARKDEKASKKGRESEREETKI